MYKEPIQWLVLRAMYTQPITITVSGSVIIICNNRVNKMNAFRNHALSKLSNMTEINSIVTYLVTSANLPDHRSVCRVIASNVLLRQAAPPTEGGGGGGPRQPPTPSTRPVPLVQASPLALNAASCSSSNWKMMGGVSQPTWSSRKRLDSCVSSSQYLEGREKSSSSLIFPSPSMLMLPGGHRQTRGNCHFNSSPPAVSGDNTDRPEATVTLTHLLLSVVTTQTDQRQLSL